MDTSKIHIKLYEAAKLDLDAAKVLNENNLHGPAIYHCAQVVEKCSKSIQAYYEMEINKIPEDGIGDKLRKTYSHNLDKSRRGIMKFLVQLARLTSGRPISEEDCQKLSYLQPITSDIQEFVLYFDDISDIVYDKYCAITDKSDSGYDQFLSKYKDYIGSEPNFQKEIQKARTVLRDENVKFIRYVFLMMTLTPLFLGLEEYSRYPMNEFSYYNITLLSNKSHKSSIKKLIFIIEDLFESVPLVLNQIDYLKNKIK